MPFAISVTRLRLIALALAVGVVLADSSVVILALPDILSEFSVDIAEVAWVLTAYNLVLALAAVPAAYLASRRPQPLFVVGVVVFAGASLWCALSTDLTNLVAARCVQAVGGAATICAALVIMTSVLSDEREAARRWGVAGVIGTALGPAVGGALTQLLSWQSIFIAQVPVVVVVLAGTGVALRIPTRAAGRPRVFVNAGLVLVSAALTAALFLVVLLLINGWRLSPLAAAAAVSVMPLAAIFLGSLTFFHRGGPLSRASAGAVAIAGGLGALGVMPGASVWWTIAPQILIGVGLGLSIGALTEIALDGVAHQTVHAGWTMASRHLGVVIGILVLTPVFVADLDRQQERAKDAVTSLVLDAPINPMTKVTLARSGVKVINGSNKRIPDVAPIFRDLNADEADKPELATLEVRLEDQLARAATTAAGRSFTVASVLAAMALIPLGIAARRSRS